MNLLLLTLALGVPSILISKGLLKRWFTAVFWYWFAWLIALSCAALSARLGLLPSLGPLAQRLVIDSHTGAFAGFLLATIILWLAERRKKGNVQPITSFTFSPRLLKHLTRFYLALAVIHLVYRISLVGIGDLLLYSMRQDFLALRDPLRITQFSSIAFTLVLPIFALLAAEDNQEGSVRLKRLLPLYVAGLIHGVAMGGRIWLLTPLLYYVFSYLLMTKANNHQAVKNLLWSLRFIPVLVVFLFVTLGLLKSAENAPGRNAEHWYQNPTGVMSPIVYAGVALASIDETAWNAAQIRPLGGQLLFPWFAGRLNSLGLLDNYMSQIDVVRRDLVLQVDWRIASTQCTVLCLAVGDFGISGVLIAMAVLMGTCQLISVVWTARGIVRHMVATIAVMAAFMTVQDTWFGNPANVVGILGTILLSWLIKEYARKDEILQRRAVLRMARLRPAATIKSHQSRGIAEKL